VEKKSEKTATDSIDINWTLIITFGIAIIIGTLVAVYFPDSHISTNNPNIEITARCLFGFVACIISVPIIGALAGAVN